MTATIETEFGFIQLRRRGATVEHRRLNKYGWHWSPWTVRSKYSLRVHADRAISRLRARHDGEWGLTP